MTGEGDFLALTLALRRSVRRRLVTTVPWVPLALLRLLPAVTRAVLVRLLALPAGAGVRLADLAPWLRVPAADVRRTADTLAALCLVERRAGDVLALAPRVVAALQPAVLADTAPAWQAPCAPPPSTADPADPAALAADLAAHAHARMTALQEYVVSRGDSGNRQGFVSSDSATASVATMGTTATATATAIATVATRATPAPSQCLLRGREPEEQPGEVLALLDQAGLFDSPARALNSAGFQFLLTDTRAQIRTLLAAGVRQPLRACAADAPKAARKAAAQRAAAALALVLRLMFLAPAQPYSTRDLDDTQRALLALLHELCLVRLDAAHAVFWPAPLLTDALTLGNATAETTSSTTTAATAATGERRGSVIVEPNRHVYGYGLTALEEALLQLFCDKCHALPGGGLFVGTLSRQSVRRALARGITCQQIAQFLHVNAHPQCHARHYVIPENIVDQMRLWEDETRYLTTTFAYYFQDFASPAHYAAARDAARTANGLLWHDDAAQRLCVAPHAVAALSAYISNTPLQLPPPGASATTVS